MYCGDIRSQVMIIATLRNNLVLSVCFDIVERSYQKNNIYISPWFFSFRSAIELYKDFDPSDMTFNPAIPKQPRQQSKKKVRASEGRSTHVFMLRQFLE